MGKIILTRLERKKEQFRKRLRIKKAEVRVTDKKIAESMGVSQPAITYKNKKAQYSYEELLILFDKLGYTDEEILQVMTMRG